MSLKDSKPFQVHRKSDYAAMADQLKAMFNQVLELRKSKKQQVRKAGKIRRHLSSYLDHG